MTLDGVKLDASSLSGQAICSGSNDHPEWADNKIVIRNSTIEAGHVGIQLENAHNLTIENSTINHGYFGINQNGENPGSTITLKDCNISGTYSGIYLSNYAGGTKNTLKVEGGKIHSEVESAIEVKKTDISVTGATLSSDASKQSYSVNGGGSNSTGYGIVLAGYAVGTAYEGETSFTNNTFNLAAGENAAGILRYDGKTSVISATSSEELAAAAIADNAIVYLTKGEYVIPASAKGKTVTFIGTGNAANTIIECKTEGHDKLNGSTVTFENLTIETDNETYRGFIHVSGATYKNCIIKNQLTLYSDGNPLLFDNCTFQVSGNNYNVWTWGTSATFEDCTFNCAGKAMLVYGGGTSEVTFTNCIFNDLGGESGKAAIETGNDYDATYTININKCTVNGFDVNSVSGSNVWGNKNSMTRDKLNVIIDNIEVY